MTERKRRTPTPSEHKEWRRRALLRRFRYRYPKRTPAQIKWQLQHALAFRKAHHGDTAMLVRLLRAKGDDAMADLIARGKWTSGGAPPLKQDDQIKYQIIAAVRVNERIERRSTKCGKLKWGRRPQIVELVMTAFAEDGSLNGLKDEERETLREAVMLALERGPDKRRH